ncbi:amidase family protein [Streptomyces boluensis]|uniref:Amidase n=1 Tax=Streptomyces boluensis TaxID=1775135 RepID=A0A964XQ87_9ACTN|nr:amidase [Streptomyces boluensis]NBE55567.1 amidase [Streptomyces boluensis]
MSLYAPWSLRALVRDLATGATTSRAALDRARARLDATEPELAAWVVTSTEPDLSSSAGALGGVPFGVKDIVDVAGLPTRCGSALRADAAPARADAPIVRAWRRAGAVVLGKTVTTEFAFFAPGPTHNPAAPGHTPGGSSSGSAAAVAAGHVPLAIGSQTAGSVTRPAAYCGVASLVLTHGRFPLDGVVGLSPSLDSHGVFAASAADLAVAWSALDGRGLDKAALDGSALDGAAAAPGRPPRVLFWSAEALGVVDGEMREALRSVRSRLADGGALVDDFPEERLVAEVTAAHPVVMAYEAARERAEERAVADRLSAPLAALLRAGERTTDAEYDEARRTVAAARIRIAELLSTYDVIVGPAAPGAAPEGLAATGDPALSRAWQACGLPAVAVPGLRAADGRPLGIQVVGPAHDEARLLAHGTWIENHLA